MNTEPVIPLWPLYHLTADQAGTVTVDGPAARPGPYPDRHHATAVIAELAGLIPRAVRAEAAEADGTTWQLLIHPDGTVSQVTPPTAQRRRTATRPHPRPEPAATPTPVPPHLPGPTLPAGQSQTATPVLAPHRQEPTVNLSRRPKRPRAEPEPTVSIGRRSRRQRHESSTRRPTAAAAQPAPTESDPAWRRVRELEEAGQQEAAYQLAGEIDNAASSAYGPSHPHAINAREVRAYLAMRAGQPERAVDLYRDVAERQWLQGAKDAAEQSAGQAHAAWLTIRDPETAHQIGSAVVRMRTLIPGPENRAYHHATEHMHELAENLGQ